MADERELSLDDIFYMALVDKDELNELAQSAGHECIKIYLHWTAGWYDQLYTDHYHLSIDADGKIFSSVDDLTDVLPATWKRNTGSVSITMACGALCTTNDLGEAPPTQAQIETMAKLIACLCDAFNLPVNTRTVLTHGEAADLLDGDTAGYDYEDAYGCQNGCERWDLQFLGTPESPEFTTDYSDPSTGGNVLRGKANWYLQNGYK